MNSSVILLLIVFSANLAAQKGTLVVEIQNVQHKEGYVEVSIYKDPATFLEEGAAYQMKRVKVNDKSGQQLKIKFESLPLGKYAAAGFHDVNGDEVFDRNIIGIPKEPYLLYNCSGIRLTKPHFDEASFHFKEHEQVISITLQ